MVEGIYRQLHYWKRRCELAEKYIKESPCDPDITKDQIEAHKQWLKQKEMPTPNIWADD